MNQSGPDRSQHSSGAQPATCSGLDEALLSCTSSPGLQSLRELISGERSGRPIFEGKFDLSALDLKNISICNATIFGSIRVGAGQHLRLVNVVLFADIDLEVGARIRFIDGQEFVCNRTKNVNFDDLFVVRSAVALELLPEERLSSVLQIDDVEEFRSAWGEVYNEALELFGQAYNLDEHSKTTRAEIVSHMCKDIWCRQTCEHLIESGFISPGDSTQNECEQDCNKRLTQVQDWLARFEEVKQAKHVLLEARIAEVMPELLPVEKFEEILSRDAAYIIELAARARQLLARSEQDRLNIREALDFGLISEEDLEAEFLADLVPDELSDRLAAYGDAARSYFDGLVQAPELKLATAERCQDLLDHLPDTLDEIADLTALVQTVKRCEHVRQEALNAGLISAAQSNAIKAIQNPDERVLALADVEESLDKINHIYRISGNLMRYGILSAAELAKIHASGNIDRIMHALEAYLPEYEMEERLRLEVARGVQLGKIEQTTANQVFEIKDRSTRLDKLRHLTELVQRSFDAESAADG